MKNWKTTLFGALAAVALALSGLVPDFSEIIMAVAGLFTALAAYFAKDKDVTGGTTPQ